MVPDMIKRERPALPPFITLSRRIPFVVDGEKPVPGRTMFEKRVIPGNLVVWGETEEQAEERLVAALADQFYRAKTVWHLFRDALGRMQEEDINEFMRQGAIAHWKRLVPRSLRLAKVNVEIQMIDMEEEDAFDPKELLAGAAS
jgi:hypothetical protein